MNCGDFERQILLADSGELALPDAAALEKHLAGCAACRACRESARRMARDAREALPADGPAPAVLARIREAAAARAAERPLAWPGPALRILAYAAGLALVAGGGWGVFSLRGGPQDRTEQIAHVTAIMTVVSGDEAGAAETAAEGDGSAGEEPLRALARRLLQMQGLSGEPSEESALPGVTPGAPPPTETRSRSSPWPRATGCV